ncbi:MAG TPA: hypothetical protein VH143_34830 [Kofleriaceae bacterium]|jgi:hypothetical protein|nr:hypothetical protein [Kofleriaceae bacterium]
MRPHVVVALIVFGCGKSPSKDPSKQADPPAPAPATAPSPSEPATPVAKTPSTPPPQICSIVAAADVGAMYGKKAAMIATGSGGSCEYQLDPAEKEKQMQQTGGMAGMMKSAQSGKGIAVPTALSEQLDVNVSVEQKDETEDSVKQIYAQVGAAVNGATKPLPKQGMGSDLIAVQSDIAGVGDWAFATNVASVNLGGMMSMRGRLLEAKKGPWRLTVSATIGPDPGAAKLDDENAAFAKAVIAKLP